MAANDRQGRRDARHRRRSSGVCDGLDHQWPGRARRHRGSLAVWHLMPCSAPTGFGPALRRSQAQASVIVLRWYSQAGFVISNYSGFQTPAGARQSRSQAKLAGDAKEMSACDKAPRLLSLKYDVGRGGPGDVVHGRCAFLHILTPAHICRSICGAAPVEVGGVRLQASQALASDHVVETTCSSRGRNVRRVTYLVRRMTPPSLRH